MFYFQPVFLESFIFKTIVHDVLKVSEVLMVKCITPLIIQKF